MKQKYSMKNYFKEVIVLFLIVVFSNVLVEIGEEEKNYMVRPLRFFGAAIVLSLIGGYVINWINNRFNGSAPPRP